MARYELDRWEGLCEDEVTIAYGFGLSLEVQPWLRPCPWPCRCAPVMP